MLIMALTRTSRCLPRSILATWPCICHREPAYPRLVGTIEGDMSPAVDDARVPIAAAVIVNNGEVLMVRRRVEERDLSWQFPAGKVQPGESGDDAAVRETQEETGLTVRAVGRLGSRVHPTTGRVMLYVACEVVSGTAYVAAERELAEVAWCDRATLAGKLSFSFHGPVQEHLNVNLR